jgi:predicted nucleotidyltransferase
MVSSTRVTDDLAARVTRLLGAARPTGITSAYLFGSHAEHRAHRESDVDVGFLLDRAAHSSEEARFSERVRLSAWLVAELRTNVVDVVVLNDLPPGLASRIVTQGVLVYCASSEDDHAFRRDVQLRAADLEPLPEADATAEAGHPDPVTYLVERLVELRRHLGHLHVIRPLVTGREVLDTTSRLTDEADRG